MAMDAQHGRAPKALGGSLFTLERRDGMEDVITTGENNRAK